MKFIETGIVGAYLIELEFLTDDRGFFSRAWCADEFKEQGLDANIAQCNLSYNKKRGTVRGLHYQKPPHEEVKIVRCIQGAIFDVIVDIRRDSSSYLKSFSVELNAENRLALYVPKGCAHGYQALEDESEVFYFTSVAYHPESEASLRWDDPALKINWPEKVTEISDKDARAEDWEI